MKSSHHHHHSHSHSNNSSSVAATAAAATRHHHQHYYSSSPPSFPKTFARLIVLIILFVGIFHHINYVEGYSGGGRFSGGGFGAGNIGSSFGRHGSFGGGAGAGSKFGFGGGGGGGGTFFSRPRWWILGMGTFGSKNKAAQINTTNDVINNESSKHIPATVDQLAGVVGIFYICTWIAYFMYKFTFKAGQYGQSEFSLLHCLSYVAFAAFSIVAFQIPLELNDKKALVVFDYNDDDSELGSDNFVEDAWDQWFDPNSTIFIQLGDSPLNYFDLSFSGIGLILTTFIILKDCAFTNGLLTINMLTKLSCFGFSIVMLVALCIGFISSSWKIPLIIFAITSLALTLIRYFGLVFIHEHCGLSLSPSAKPNFIPVSRSKCFWLNRLEILGGILSILFHALMIYNYEDITIGYINIIPIGISGLAILFPFLFMIRLAWSKPRYDRYMIPPSCADTFGDGMDSCKGMLKMN